MSRSAYNERINAVVGDQDPLRILEATPVRLSEMIETASIDVLRTRPFVDKWSPLEIVAHLSDHEVAMAYRLRRLILQDAERFDGYAQERWVERQRHNERDPREVTALFTTLRADSLRLWRLATPGQLERVALRDGTMAEPIAFMRRAHAGHDLIHLDQLKRYLDAVRGAGSA